MTPEDDDPLLGLARLSQARAALDRSEHELIATARARGLSWGQIADALGLRSRQAAEQRWLRLTEPGQRDPAPVRAERRRQRGVDECAGPAMSSLRAATAAAVRRLDVEPGWDTLHPRAALARASLAAAVSAEPGGLFSLVRHAIDDLDAVSVEECGRGLRQALDRLRRAWQAAQPH